MRTAIRALDSIMSHLLGATDAHERGQLLHDAYMQSREVRAALEAADEAPTCWPEYPLAAAYMVQRFCR